MRVINHGFALRLMKYCRPAGTLRYRLGVAGVRARGPHAAATNRKIRPQWKHLLHQALRAAAQLEHKI